MSVLAAYREKLRSSALARGFFATLLGSGTSKLIFFLATFIFTHILEKDDFGSFSFIRNTMNVILTVCALNYTGLLTKFSAEFKYDGKSLPRAILLLLFTLVISLMVGAVLLFMPEKSLSSVSGFASLTSFFRIIGLLLPLFMLQPLVEAVFRGLKMFRLIGLLQTASAIVFTALVVVGALLKGTDGAVAGLLLYYLVYALASAAIFVGKLDLSSCGSLSFKSLRAESKVIWTMILPVFVLSFVEAPVNWWSQVLVTRYGSMGSIGSMSAILQLRNVLIIIPTYFFSTFMPFQATMNAEGNQDKYFRYLSSSFGISLGLGVLLALFMCVMSPVLLGLYGDSYICDSPSMYVAMFSFPLMMCVGLLRGSLIIKEHQRLMMVTSIVASALQLLVMYVLLPRAVNPVVTYFWAQFAFYTVFFVVYVLCSCYDYKKRSYC